MDGFSCAPQEGGLGDLFDVSGMVVNAITSFLGMLIEQIMKPVRELLADTLLATPDVTQHADIKKLWTTMLGITAGIYVLFVTAGGVTVMGYETVQTRYALQQILPRLLFGMVAAATSLTVMGKAIALSNALAHAVMASDMSDAGQGMVEQVLPFALFGAAGLKLYLLLLATMMIALVLAVLVGFLVRVAVMALLAVAAPLALACHAHPLTDPVARLWWRALAGCLVIQVAQSMTFILALKLFFAPGATALGIPKSDQLGTMLAGAALFWVLFKIPGWTLQVVLRGTPAHSPHAPTGVRMLKHLAMYRLMDHYLPGMQLLRRRPGGGGRGGGGRPFTPGPPGRGAGSVGRARSAGRAWLSRGRDAVAGTTAARLRSTGPAAGTPSGPNPSRATGSSTRPEPAATSSPRAAPRPLTARSPRARGPVPTSLASPTRTPRGPRAVMHPARARRVRQLALPVAAQRVPSRPPRPTQMWLPIRAERLTARSRSERGRPAPPSLPAAAAASRGRQLVLPISAPRVRVRPPRPMQLRLPLEPRR
ncbi:hypothetical protein DMH02_018195 [Streptomyces sp. WAC 00631]|uniref:hypothetical protein n=1 Tax=Streptomyces sp. WAC 00631 TaxID=2203201 RepID=UPI001E2F0AB1|nr:hypothetical protein [Streptomyces sp. WAC 00631]MCC5035090.1 hypothetical protein [Streptomyces sp. WAC 00631]